MMTVPIKKPGGYQLRAAVRDHGSERVGSASQFVEVPDIKKNRLTLSGIVITSFDPAAVKKSAVPANATAGNPTNADNKGEGEGVSNPRNSAAVRQFHAGEILDYGLVVYNARLDKSGTQPQLQLQVRLFRDGQPVFTGKEQPFSLSGPHDFKRLATAGGIQLGAKMVPGEYVLQIIVKDSLADEKHRVATQWIDFEIVK
jgi:hypothetical protein